MVKNKSSYSSKNTKHKKRTWYIILGGGIVLAFFFMAHKIIPPGLEKDKDGNITLAPDRQAKLNKELEEIDNAEQYVLVAQRSGLYPCYSCTNGQKTIYLNVGEVWKYGVTRKGLQGRYPRENFGVPDLNYFQQFIGTYSECLKKEKIKIYNYPFLPEALARDILLIRPPGNKYDS